MLTNQTANKNRSDFFKKKKKKIDGVSINSVAHIKDVSERELSIILSNVLHFTSSIVTSELEVHEISSKYNLKLISKKCNFRI